MFIPQTRLTSISFALFCSFGFFALTGCSHASVTRYSWPTDYTQTLEPTPNKPYVCMPLYNVVKGDNLWLHFAALNWKTPPQKAEFEVAWTFRNSPGHQWDNRSGNVFDVYFMPKADWYSNTLTFNNAPHLPAQPVGTVTAPGGQNAMLRVDLTTELQALGAGKDWTLVIAPRTANTSFFYIHWSTLREPRSAHLKLTFPGDTQQYMVRKKQGTDDSTLFLEGEGFDTQEFSETERDYEFSGGMGMGTAIPGATMTKQFQLAAGGTYNIGVHYRNQQTDPYKLDATPFELTIKQNGVTKLTHTFTPKAGDDKPQWGWTTANLDSGPAEITITASKDAAVYVDIDGVLLTRGEVKEADLNEFIRPLFFRLTPRAGDASAYYGIGAPNQAFLPSNYITKAGIRRDTAPATDDMFKPGESTGWVNISPLINPPFFRPMNYTLRNRIWLFAYGADHKMMPAINVDVEIATAPNEKAVFKKFNAHGDMPGIGMLMQPDWFNGLNPDAQIQSVQELIDEKLAFVKSLPPAYRGKSITVLTQLQTIPQFTVSTAQYKQELDILARLGFNGLRHPQKGATEAGMTMNNINAIIGEHTFKNSFALPDLKFYDKDFRAAAQDEKDKGLLDSIATFDVEDELYSPSVASLNATALDQFYKYLEEHHYKPSQFGATSWNGIKLLEPEDAEKDPLLFYVGTNFRHQVYNNLTKSATEIVHKYFPHALTQSNHSWDGAFSSSSGTSLAGRGPNFWEVYHQKCLDFAMTEDWLIFQYSPQLSGFLMETLRSATRGTGVNRGCFVIGMGQARDQESAYKAYSEVAHGSHKVAWYCYGPDYIGLSDYWPVTYDKKRLGFIHQVNDDIGRADFILGTAQEPADDVAILWPWSTDVWTWASGDRADGFERTALWLALQHAQIPSEIITENDVASDYLKTKKVLYLTGTNLRDDVARKIAAWVKAGGVLYLGPGDATKNYLNKPMNILDKALGFSREPLEIKDPVYNAANFWGHKTFGKIKYGSGEMDVMCYWQPFHAPANAKVLATAEDGSPAAVEFAAGKGRVVLTSFQPGLSYAHKAMVAFHEASPADLVGDIPPSWPSAGRQLLAYPARIGKARQDVKLSVPVVEATRLENEKGIAIPLINWTMKPISTLTVSIPNANGIKSIESLRQGKLKARHVGNTLVVTIPLDKRDMLLLRR